jgi:hypothetical protein
MGAPVRDAGRDSYYCRIAVDAFHERLARIGLAAAARYGSALAGGYYAVQAAAGRGLARQ